jgi:hypothetical protein
MIFNCNSYLETRMTGMRVRDVAMVPLESSNMQITEVTLLSVCEISLSRIGAFAFIEVLRRYGFEACMFELDRCTG